MKSIRSMICYHSRCMCNLEIIYLINSKLAIYDSVPNTVISDGVISAVSFELFIYANESWAAYPSPCPDIIIVIVEQQCQRICARPWLAINFIKKWYLFWDLGRHENSLPRLLIFMLFSGSWQLALPHIFILPHKHNDISILHSESAQVLVQPGKALLRLEKWKHRLIHRHRADWLRIVDYVNALLTWRCI